MIWKNSINDFYKFLLIEKGLSKNTIESYSRDVNKLALFLEEYNINKSPINITTEDLQGFIYHISKSLQPRSQARLLSGLKSFFDYLVIEQYREGNPVEIIESPKIGLKLPDSLTKEEIDDIIDLIDLSHPQGLRNKTILETLYGCGLRVSELIDLKISDLFFNDGFIKVTGKGNKQRLVPITYYTEQIIKEYINSQRNLLSIQKGHEDFVFLNRRGKKLTRVMIFTIIKNLASQMGTPKKISPHTFRHSFASHLLENGAELNIIQQLLGHESITTTEIYLHVDKSQLKKIVERFHPKAK